MRCTPQCVILHDIAFAVAHNTNMNRSEKARDKHIAIECNQSERERTMWIEASGSESSRTYKLESGVRLMQKVHTPHTHTHSNVPHIDVDRLALYVLHYMTPTYACSNKTQTTQCTNSRYKLCITSVYVWASSIRMQTQTKCSLRCMHITAIWKVSDGQLCCRSL